MSKAKYSLRCQECGYRSPKWLGRCPGCGGWNTLAEELDGKTSLAVADLEDSSQSITSVTSLPRERNHTGLPELDRVLGGGFVSGSLVLVGGEPGIGKSTLILQVALNLAPSNKILLVSGEESFEQVKLRAERLGDISPQLHLLTETDMDHVSAAVEKINPLMIMIDSIQTLFARDIAAAPGSVSQVRECTGLLMRIAKEKNITVIISGQVTKEGYLAGPRVLEHLVDTVLYFEGDRGASHRVLRAVKNRFGPTDEIGIFSMGDEGLVSLTDASVFLPRRSWEASGAAVTASLEGTRPLLVELQALVVPSYLSVPRRLASGLNFNRVLLNLAVLGQRTGLGLDGKDVYVSVAGGVKIVEPAADLPTILAVISATRDKALSSEIVVFGEVGLTGEIRTVSQAETRLREAERMGFKSAVIPPVNGLELGKMKLNVQQVATLGEAIDAVGLS